MNRFKEIIKAYSSPVDEEQPHYKYRKSICDGCEFNTDNINPENQSIVVKGLNAFSKTSRCNACGCPLTRKCASKTSYCGLKGKIINGKVMEPKWTPVEFEMRGNRFKILNLMPETTDTEKIDKDTISVRVREYDGLVKTRLQLTDMDGINISMLKDVTLNTLVIADKVEDTPYDCSIEVSFRSEELVEGDNEIEFGIMYINLAKVTRRLNIKMLVRNDK